TIITTNLRSMAVLLTAEVEGAARRRRFSGGPHHRVLRRGCAKHDDHNLVCLGAQSLHEHAVILPPLVARVVLRVAQAASLSGRVVRARVPAVLPPLRRVTPVADDEVGVTPPASNLPAIRVPVHVRAPSWCARRVELGRGPARVRNTGRTSASHGGLGVLPGPSVFATSAPRGLPRPGPMAEFSDQVNQSGHASRRSW